MHISTYEANHRSNGNTVMKKAGRIPCSKTGVQHQVS